MLSPILRFVSAIILIAVKSSTNFVSSNFFTDTGIDESVSYHLQYGLHGAGFLDYIELIVAVALVIVLVLPTL